MAKRAPKDPQKDPAPKPTHHHSVDMAAYTVHPHDPPHIARFKRHLAAEASKHAGDCERGIDRFAAAAQLRAQIQAANDGVFVLPTEIPK